MKQLKIPNSAYIDIDFVDGILYYILTSITFGKYSSIEVTEIIGFPPLNQKLLYQDSITSHGFGRIKYPWIVYRKDISDNNEEGRLVNLSFPAPFNLGRVWGNFPFCFRTDRTQVFYQRWETQHSGNVDFRILSNIDHIWNLGVSAYATGLDRVNDLGHLISWEQNRFSEPDMQLPQRTKDYTVGEVENGFAVRRKSDNKLFTFFSERSELHDPRAIQVDNKLYVAFWQKTGPTMADSYIVQLEPADFVEIPITLPEAKPLAPFDKKMWFGAFHEFSDVYGNIGQNDQPFGNCLIITNGNLDKAAEEMLPMICTRANYAPKYDGFIFAYYESAGSLEALNANIVALNHDIYNTKLLPEKPAICVLDFGEDTDKYPANKPVWLDKDIHWLGIELYRGKNESITEMRARFDRLLVKVNNWGMYIVLIPQFYRRNWSATEIDSKKHVMEVIDDVTAYYGGSRVIGILPFTRLRGEGIQKNPEFIPFINEIRKAIVLGRPTRHFYWISKNDWRRNLITRVNASSVFDSQEKQYLVSLIKNNLGI